MDGSKSVAIISDAASTGISLHSAKGSGASHKRRIHYTIELPWSADKAVQQLGRSHRSGQESAPIYKLVVTNLGGERRFAAAVSKRLASLGALTKGDRRAATGSDMSEFDLDSKYGKRALKRFYYALQTNEASGIEEPLSSAHLPCRKAEEIIDAFVKDRRAAKDLEVLSFPTENKKVLQMCVMSDAVHELDRVGLDRDARAGSDVKKFLNRLAGLTVSRQSLVFSLFMSTLDDVIKEAKLTGEFEGTAEDIKATKIEISSEEDLAIDPSSGAPTKLTTLTLDRGIPFEFACNMAMEEANKLRKDEAENDQPLGQNVRNKVESNEDDAFIVADEEDEGRPEDSNNGEGGDEWISKSKPKRRKRAQAGFYVSKSRIAGRRLVLFAKSKFDYTAFKSEEEALDFDPLGLMQITRPNTGTNLTDMETKELERKYTLICSCKMMKEVFDEEVAKADTKATEPIDLVGIVNRTSKEAGILWKAAFKESNYFGHMNGLAPRRVIVSLVNGPVLHILSAMEKAVQFRSEKEKSLKIMRAQVDNRRIVGVRFPHDEEACQKLKDELDRIGQARRDAGSTYTDEELDPVCTKSQAWATTKPKTIKSFFQVKTPTSVSFAAGGTPKSNGPSLPAKRPAVTSLTSSGKKTKTMMSYFAKKK
jgi:hypothetical protein